MTHGQLGGLVDVDDIPVAISSVTFDPATVLNATLSNGNLSANQSGANGGAQVFVFFAKTTGKYYFEITYTTLAGSINGGVIGVAPNGTTYAQFNASTNSAVQFANGNINSNGTNFFNNNSRAQGDIVAIAADLDNRSIWFRLVSGGLWNGPVANGNPSTNTNGVAIPAGAILPYVGFSTNPSDVFTANFGASPFTGLVPSGFRSGWTP